MKSKLYKIWRKKDHPISIAVTYLLIFTFLMILQPILDYYFNFGGDEAAHFLSILIVSTITTLLIVKIYRDRVEDKKIVEE
jgi:hypothetical protein